MEKYISSIKDLVIQTITNGSEIKSKANSGDQMGCFQMGMIHLLGINTPMDFKKATHFFSNQSLSDDQDAIRLLGFIAECNGEYSSAFHYYASTESNEKDSYLDKVIKGRNHIQDCLRKLDLPLTVNKEISSILNDYSKSKTSKTSASIKIAAICEDEQTCLEAAKNLFDSKDYISAIQWLKKGNISADNAMYMAINDMFEKSKTDLLKSKVIQIVELNSNSLLTNENPTPFLNKVKKSCDNASRNCSNEWKDKANSYVGAIIKNYKDKEHQAYLDAVAEEEARKRKRNKTIKYGVIAAVVLFVIILGAIGSSSDEKDNSDKVVKKEVVVSDYSDANSNEVEESIMTEDSKDNESISINTQISLTMKLSGKIGGEAEFVMEGNNGWYRMTYDGADRTKRSLELDSYNPDNNDCIINAYLNNKYIGKFVGVITRGNNNQVDKYKGIFESVKGAKVDFNLYSE